MGSDLVNELPLNVFSQIESMKERARSGGRDVIDFGFGNPDTPSPPAAVAELLRVASDPNTHRYSRSMGILELREAIAQRYADRHGVALNPGSEVVVTIGATEGLAQLMLAIANPGDRVLVPTPSYPIHLLAPKLSGAEVSLVSVDGLPVDEHQAGLKFYERFVHAWHANDPKPRFAILSFPNNPTAACIDLETMNRLVEFARDRDLLLIHDFAYSETSFDGYFPPSILEADGGSDVAVELYSMTKTFSMAGWRVAFVVGNEEVVDALSKLKTYLDYGIFEPIQRAAVAALLTSPDYPPEINKIYWRRRDTLCDGLAAIQWPVQRAKGTMFVWARIPDPYIAMGSVGFAEYLLEEAAVCTSPGIGFGPVGDDYLRFALVEDEKRIIEAIDRFRTTLTKL